MEHVPGRFTQYRAMVNWTCLHMYTENYECRNNMYQIYKFYICRNCFLKIIVDFSEWYHKEYYQRSIIHDNFKCKH